MGAHSGGKPYGTTMSANEGLTVAEKSSFRAIHVALVPGFSLAFGV